MWCRGFGVLRGRNGTAWVPYCVLTALSAVPPDTESVRSERWIKQEDKRLLNSEIGFARQLTGIVPR